MICRCGAELKEIGFIVSGSKAYHGIEVLECDDCDSVGLAAPQGDKTVIWYTYEGPE